MIELTREQILRHKDAVVAVLTEATVKSHSRRSKTGKVYTVKQFDRQTAKLRQDLRDLKALDNKSLQPNDPIKLAISAAKEKLSKRLSKFKPTKGGYDPLRGAYAKAKANRNAASYKKKKSKGFKVKKKTGFFGRDKTQDKKRTRLTPDGWV